jgi:RNA polymerase sigma-70 factor (sigma-E family)
MPGRTLGDLHREAATEPSPDDLAELYSVITPRSVRLAYLLTSDHAFAEDVVQETFIRVMSRLGRLRDPSLVEPYLRRAVVNEVLGRRRSLARQARRERAVAASQRVEAGSPMDQVDQRVDLVDALNKLPLRQRTAILLRYWMDLSDAEVAEAMNCPIGTVKSSLSRGIETLRKAAANDH